MRLVFLLFLLKKKTKYIISFKMIFYMLIITHIIDVFLKLKKLAKYYYYFIYLYVQCKMNRFSLDFFFF